MVLCVNLIRVITERPPGKDNNKCIVFNPITIAFVSLIKVRERKRESFGNMAQLLIVCVFSGTVSSYQLVVSVH